MRIPVWVTIAAALFVGLFGVYRIYLGTKDRVIENERYDYTVRTGLQLAF